MLERVHLGTRILLGENASENDELVRWALANAPDATWVHLDAFPSGHALVLDEAPSTAVAAAAQLCLSRSKYRAQRDAKAAVTTVRNLVLTETLGEVDFYSRRRVARLVIGDSSRARPDSAEKKRAHAGKKRG